MRKEDLLNSDFLRQFKSGKELESFLSQLHKRGIEQMLEGDLIIIWVTTSTLKQTNPMPVTVTGVRP